MCNDHGRFPVPSVLLHRGFSYPLSVCYGVSVLILVWLLSFNPYAVLVDGQNLLGTCRYCSPMNQSSVNMVTTDDENSLSFQCLGSIFWGQTKCWNEYTFKWLPTSLQCFPAYEYANMQLPISFPQQWLCEHWHFRIVFRHCRIFLIQETLLNKNIPVSEVAGGGPQWTKMTMTLILF